VVMTDLAAVVNRPLENTVDGELMHLHYYRHYIFTLLKSTK